MKRIIFNKSDIIEILIIICFLLIGFSCIVYYKYKNIEKKYCRSMIILNEIAYKLKDIREEKDSLNNRINNFKFYNYVEKIYEVKDRDFFDSISVIYESSIEHEIDPYLIISIIQHESDFYQYAQSSCAYGLMQINYEAWKDTLKIDKSKIFDKRYNVDLGIKIYKYYLERAKGNTNLALFYYNNGENMPPYKANYGYSNKILKSIYLNKEK